MLITHIALLILGAFMLTVGSDKFVDAASRIARRLGVSMLIISLTLIAFATSLPELASSLLLALRGDSEMLMGNIVGSNIANIGLVLGISALVATVHVTKASLRRDSYLMLMVVSLVCLLFFAPRIAGVIGLLFLWIYAAYFTYLLQARKKLEKEGIPEFFSYFFRFRYATSIYELVERQQNHRGKSSAREDVRRFEKGMLQDLGLMLLSTIAIIKGADFFVTEAESLAQLFNLAQGFVGLTIVALGTSLPELSVSINAAKKGFGDIVAGTVVGSNITNTLLVLGGSLILNPRVAITGAIIFYVIFMIAISLFLIYLLHRHRDISRAGGLALVTSYLIFLILSFAFTG